MRKSKQRFEGWAAVAAYLHEVAQCGDGRGAWGRSLDAGQRRSLLGIARRIEQNGLMLADEVGMGKTRIAAALARCVVETGGRVAVVAPSGIGHQWQQELRKVGQDSQDVLLSFQQLLSAWDLAKPAQAPFQHPIVLVSHRFAAWQVTTKTAWRWTLLPELYAQWRRHRNGRVPHAYHQADLEPADKVAQTSRTSRAAIDIVEHVLASGHRSAQNWLDDLIQKPWNEVRVQQSYVGGASLRVELERAVGLGLGIFDLVLIDEAHKNKQEDSGLSRLLDSVIWTSATPRHLAMTATPVELDSDDWRKTLTRAGVVDSALEARINRYASAVQRVRERPTQEMVIDDFCREAKAFQTALSPYLLRRDKRESEAVVRFVKGGHSQHAYRRQTDIAIDIESLPIAWRRAIVAAEALALLGRTPSDTATQRLRLTMGNGHGLSTVLDLHTLARASEKGMFDTETKSQGLPLDAIDASRRDWWIEVLAGAFEGSTASLYEHPAILATVAAVEAADAQGEKVLVFGRFSRPMRALKLLLDARALLRRLDAGLPWPQSTRNDEEWEATQAAHRQLGRADALDRNELDARLKAEYDALETSRAKVRSNLIDWLAAALPPAGRARHFVDAVTSGRLDLPAATLSLLARALADALGVEAEHAEAAHWASVFTELIDAASDVDRDDEEGESEDLEKDWWALTQRLHAEYASPQGGFARLLEGNTPAPTRRFLQLAFNRANSYPRVLVAQSLVGREGLNLHRACRTVILMHPEWNPGVVEQQIGRVDRVGSRWEQLLGAAIEADVAPADWPRIEVQTVIFRGTYDEENWRVLRRRWDDLRSQLHGVVIPESERTGHADLDACIERINAAAPSFSP